MSAIRLQVTRPAGRVLVVGSEGCRATPLEMLRISGFTCGESDNPYTAILEISRQTGNYGALLLCLNSLYTEELAMIAAVKKRWPRLDIWLAQTENRQSTMTEAIQLGADGVLDHDGFHRTVTLPAAKDQPAGRPAQPSQPLPLRTKSPALPKSPSPGKSKKSIPAPNAEKVTTTDKIQETTHLVDQSYVDTSDGEPILTAAELRALLADAPPPDEPKP